MGVRRFTSDAGTRTVFRAFRGCFFVVAVGACLLNIRVDGQPEQRRDASSRSTVNKETEDALCRCRSRIVALPGGRPEIKIDRELIDRVYGLERESCGVPRIGEFAGNVAAASCYPAVSNIVTVSEVGGLRVGDAYNY